MTTAPVPPVAKKPPPEPVVESKPPEPPPPPPPPVIVTVRPDYPGWFRPLANLAEKKPTGALMVTISGLLVSGLIGLAIGVAIGWFAKG